MASSPQPLGYGDNAMFNWVEDMPQPRNSRAMQKEQAQHIYNASLALPYRGEWNAELQSYVMDPMFEGMTYGEVIILKQVMRAAEGDQKATDSVMDRVLGKPKQALETKSMHMSYTEFLEASAQEEAERTAAQFYDVSAYEVESDEDDLLDGV